VLARDAGGAQVEVTAEVVRVRTVGADTGAALAGGRAGEVYTVFVLNCSGGGVVWEVNRRYSEFAELHQKLLASLPSAKGQASRARAALTARMPRKVYFGSNSPQVVAERHVMLTSYVCTVQRVLNQQSSEQSPEILTSEILTTPSESSWVNACCDAWLLFCAVPSTAFAAAALVRSPRRGLSTGGMQSVQKGTVRGVLRRGTSQERKAKKKVEVEEGRRQVSSCIISCICMYVCTYVCMFVGMYVRMYGCMYVCLYVCMYICIHVCMYVCMNVFTAVCVYTKLYVCMYIQLWTNLSSTLRFCKQAGRIASYFF